MLCCLTIKSPRRYQCLQYRRQGFCNAEVGKAPSVEQLFVILTCRSVINEKIYISCIDYLQRKAMRYTSIIECTVLAGTRCGGYTAIPQPGATTHSSPDIVVYINAVLIQRSIRLLVGIGNRDIVLSQDSGRDTQKAALQQLSPRTHHSGV
jgi:hypothetical protein